MSEIFIILLTVLSVAIGIAIMVSISRCTYGIKGPQKFEANEWTSMPDCLCPKCGKQMQKGFVHTTHFIGYWEKYKEPDTYKRRTGVHSYLSWWGFTKPRNLAWNCPNCQTVIIDYHARYRIDKQAFSTMMRRER